MIWPQDAPEPRAETGGDLDLGGFDERKGGEQGAHDEGRIDRHLGQDHAPGGIEEIDRRQGKLEGRHQRHVEDSGRAVEKGEGERHQEGRQGNDGIDEARQERCAGEGHEGDDERQDETQQQAAGAGGKRDADRVQDCLAEHRRAEYGPDGFEREAAGVAGERLGDDQGQGIEEAAGENQERRRDPKGAKVEGREPRSTWPWRS